MDLEERLRASLVAPDPGAVFTARVMARVRRGVARRRSSFILVGTVLVVGAAAAMLTWQMSAVQSPQVESAAVPAVSGPEPVADEPVAQEIAQASGSDTAVPELAPPTGASRRYSVLVLPLRQESQDASKRGLVETFHAATLDELRKVPGLSLQEPGESERRAGGQPDYVLTITGLASRAPQSDSAACVEMRAESGQSAASRQTSPPGAGGTCPSYGSGAMVGVVNLVLNNRLTGFNVDMDYDINEAGEGSSARMNPARSAASPVEVLRVQVFPREDAFQQRCDSSNAARLPECMTPAQLAATQVEILRLKVFPPDAAFQQSLVARLGDIRPDQPRGSRALQDLLQALTADSGSRLDAGTIQALVRYAARQPAGPRQYVWNTLRQVSHPALVAPLVESLQHDPDQKVRLAALVSLETNHATDSAVRTALERIGREDQDEVVRLAVRRALYGQAQWRDEILAALQSSTLPYAARLAPLIAIGPEITQRQQAQRRAALQEQQVLRPLVAMIREHLANTDHAEVTSRALGQLGSVDDPAVHDLFMQVMRETPALKQETTKRGNTISMSGPVSTWVFRHRADPRVLQSLSDVDPQLRSVMEPPREMAGSALPPREITGSAVSTAPVDLDIIPSDLIKRMQEVTEKARSTAPVTQ